MVELSEAVSGGLIIKFVYDGLDRVVIPTAHGLHFSTGKKQFAAIKPKGGVILCNHQRVGDCSP